MPEEEAVSETPAGAADGSAATDRTGEALGDAPAPDTPPADEA
jgi:hypothetical protein